MRTPDRKLLAALAKAYTARAILFHDAIAASNIDILIAEIDLIRGRGLKWDLARLGISPSSFQRLKHLGENPLKVFAHSDVILQRPHLVAYYRNIATISQKGITQILFSTARYEAKRAKSMTPADAEKICQTINPIISGVIDANPRYVVETSRKAIYAELGAQIQGTWANLIGKGASRAVEKVLQQHIDQAKVGRSVGKGKFQLNNNWTIVFGTEPDVAFLDNKGIKRIAIEIKGSLDTAGAQTRYGEAKKTFAKQLAQNPRCHTIYLASCFTDAVIKQIEDDGQVREYFNLTSILYDEQDRRRFLDRLFHIVNVPR
jgi:hypothetical protein